MQATLFQDLAIKLEPLNAKIPQVRFAICWEPHWNITWYIVLKYHNMIYPYPSPFNSFSHIYCKLQTISWQFQIPVVSWVWVLQEAGYWQGPSQVAKKFTSTSEYWDKSSMKYVAPGVGDHYSSALLVWILLTVNKTIALCSSWKIVFKAVNFGNLFLRRFLYKICKKIHRAVWGPK